MKRRIAIPTNNGKLCSHFGHCEKFYFADIEDGKMIAHEFVSPPRHEPGVYPAWIKEQGATEVICGGIGQKAIALFQKEGIKLYIGVESNDPNMVVEAFLNNTLSTGENACDH